MKAITCEMCNSTDVVKIDGMYVCQACGTKYSVEEARKLMIEGTVDVSGSTVKVDNSERNENILKLARRASEDGNNAEAAKYYEQIMLDDPSNWEAVYYFNYHTAMQTNIAGISSAADRMANCIPTVLDLIQKSETGEARTAAVKKVGESSESIAKLLIDNAYRHFNEIDDSVRYKYMSELNDRTNHSNNIIVTLINNIFTRFESDKNLMTLAVSLSKEYIELFPDKNGIFELIAKHDPNGTAFEEQYREKQAEKAEAHHQKAKKSNITGVIISAIIAIIAFIIGYKTSGVFWWIVGGFASFIAVGTLSLMALASRSSD